MYGALFLKAFLNGLQYRTRALLNLLGFALSVFVQISLWQALYATGSAQADVGGFRQMTTYIILTSLLSAFYMRDVGGRLGERVISGDIAMDMIKPYSLRSYFMAQSLGENMFFLLFVTLPILIVVALIHPPLAPVSLSAGLMALLLAALGSVVGLYFYYILGLWVFWLKNDWYIDWIVGALMTLFGGRMVPLWMYPDWLYQISRFLPFRYFRYEAVSVYLGQSAAPLEALLVECVWLVLFILLERIIWRAAQHKIFVLGG